MIQQQLLLLAHISESSASQRSARMAVSPTRVWVGPVLLILLIALIYVFSLLPSNFKAYPDERRGFELQAELDRLHFSRLCSFNGEERAGRCLCEVHAASQLPLFAGDRCEHRLCLNNGTLLSSGQCLCDATEHFYGQHCEKACHGNLTTIGHEQFCVCQNRRFGDNCEHHCNERLAFFSEKTGFCKCQNGFDPPSCTSCLTTSCVQQTIQTSKTNSGIVNNRLTLSGLSFCLISIGLLCITARKKRLASPTIPRGDETWYRVFQPQYPPPTDDEGGSRRCRHDFMCGGTWLPRDRALLVGSPNRPNPQARIARNNRSLTPPPSYYSVEDLQTSSPPTYDEAMTRSSHTSEPVQPDANQNHAIDIEAQNNNSQSDKDSTEEVTRSQSSTPSPSTP